MNQSRERPMRAQKREDARPTEAEAEATPGKSKVSTGLVRIAELAKEQPKLAFTSLAHHVTMGKLETQFEALKKTSAPGVDGQTVKQYEENLMENLRDLYQRFRSDSYRAPPVRRVHIPKGTGPETRPIGIPTVEDKILQGAVARVLEAIYEQDFKPCSFGFRRRRGAHDALKTIWTTTRVMQGCWILEVDIRKFFDTLDHGKLRELLQIRVRDGVLLRLINRWLKAGILEAGELSYPVEGTPQGGVISPLLANVYLHYVLDEWFDNEIRPTLKGNAYLVRYADDFVIGFEEEEDARYVMAALPERFSAYGLTIHPDKTRLIDFRRPDRKAEAGEDGDAGSALPTAFDFLAFNHRWERSLRGNWVVRQATSKSRFARALAKFADWCKANRHMRVDEQAKLLSQKLNGHYGYFGITGNYPRLHQFQRAVERIWHKWLNRRSQRRSMTWDRFNRLLKRHPLAKARVPHSVFRRAAKSWS
jgi:RNA-directed DNA polymerase